MDYNSSEVNNQEVQTNQVVESVVYVEQPVAEVVQHPVYKGHKKGNGKLIILFVISIILSVCLGAGGVLLFLKSNPDFIKSGDTITNINKSEKEVTITDTGIADAVEKVYDSVVIVETFDKNKMIATGTGFVFKQANGTYYILTNHHVIEDGNLVKVMFTNGSEVNVNIVGSDKYSDVAVLSYRSASTINVAQMGDTSSMRVGDTVFAIGAPLDSSVYSWSVTRGVLSGKDREVEVSTNNGNTSDWIMQVLQTDAAINSGNSGGPLCNSNGEVVGITNMKLVTDGVEGMGFAIPIEEAIAFANKIINGEDIRRPYIGIGMVDARDQAYAMQYGISATVGVLVTNVEANSPAAKAGLQSGDVITKINGVDIKGIATLRYELYKNGVGDNISVTYLRNGRTNSTTLTLVAGSNN